MVQIPEWKQVMRSDAGFIECPEYRGNPRAAAVNVSQAKP
jgi:hypothetical protein